MSRMSRRIARSRVAWAGTRALAVGTALAASACVASPPVPARPPAAMPGPSVQPVPAASAPLPAASKPTRPTGRVGLIVHVDPAAVAVGTAADERLRAELRALGAVVRGRVDGAQTALLVEAPAEAMARIRALPGVRAVGTMPDAERWPGLPDR